MAARDIAAEILARTDIVGLISNYVTLHRAGANMVGLCPFHSERTPSFTVFPGSNSFYCFGCGAGGDAITFVRRMENLDFPDALEQLAKRAGIRIPQEPQLYQGKKYDRNRFFAMNREAARFFHQTLRDGEAESIAAMDYLVKKRGLSTATITHFGLGFAPPGYETFPAYMLDKGYTPDELTTAFLCGRSERSGRLYASFRNRVMFPIIDLSGNIIAFGGRVMDDSLPKYKNSSDTPVFRKSRNLFALNFARSACAEQLILCEGYMDVIALHAAGFTNAVATLGTSLTEEQARILTRYTKKVIIAYDMDEAGRRAADRAIRMFGDVGLEARFLRLDGAKDPDEYIKKYGADRFRQMLGESRSRFDYYYENVLTKYDLHSPQEKVRALSEMCTLIASFPSPAEREVYITEIARRFDVKADSLRSEIGRLLRRRLTEANRQQVQKMHQAASGYNDRVNPDFARNPGVARAEENVLGMLLIREEHRKAAFSPPISLTEADFSTALGKKIFAFLKKCEEEGRGPDTPDAYFTTEEVGRITRMKVMRMQLTENGDAVFSECVRQLRRAVAEQSQETETPTLTDLTALVRRRKEEVDLPSEGDGKINE